MVEEILPSSPPFSYLSVVGCDRRLGPALRKIALPGRVLSHLQGGIVRFYLTMPPTVPARPRTRVHLCPPIPTPDRGCFCTSELYASSGWFVNDRGVRSIVKGESVPHKGSGGPTMTPLLFFWEKKKHNFWVCSCSDREHLHLSSGECTHVTTCHRT